MIVQFRVEVFLAESTIFSADEMYNHFRFSVFFLTYFFYHEITLRNSPIYAVRSRWRIYRKRKDLYALSVKQ